MDLLSPDLARTFFLANQCSFGRLAHVAHLQVFQHHQRVLLADCGSGFVEKILSNIRNLGVNALNLLLGLVPVLATFTFRAMRR